MSCGNLLREMILAALVVAAGSAGEADELRILIVGNYHTEQGEFPDVLRLVANHTGVAETVHVWRAGGLYGHGDYSEDVDQDQAMRFILGEGKAVDHRGRPIKKKETLALIEPFVGRPPDIVLLQFYAHIDTEGGNTNAKRKAKEALGHIVPGTKRYAEVCAEKGVKLVLWVHPAHQHNRRNRQGPRTEEEHAAELAVIERNIAMIREEAPTIARVVDFATVMAAFRKAHPDLDIQTPRGDPDTHLGPRVHYALACATAAALGGTRPESGPDLALLNTWWDFGGVRTIRQRGEVNTDLWKLTPEQQAAIHEVVWSTVEPITEEQP